MGSRPRTVSPCACGSSWDFLLTAEIGQLWCLLLASLGRCRGPRRGERLPVPGQLRRQLLVPLDLPAGRRLDPGVAARRAGDEAMRLAGRIAGALRIAAVPHGDSGDRRDRLVPLD